MLTAIIVAAGSGVRAGFDKLFALLDGQPVVAHAVAAFQKCESVSEIIVVGRADQVGALQELLGGVSDKITHVIAGGARRQDSVFAGLQHLGAAAEFVAVHDAARPLVTPAIIERVYAAARQYGAASAAAPVVDTLKRADAENFVAGSLDRAGLFAMQTPQIFERRRLETAYTATMADGVEITDEVSAIERSGGRVRLVPAEDFNFKITYRKDLELAELALRSRRLSTPR